MKEIIQKFKQAGERVSLSQSEKSAGKRVLLAHMNNSRFPIISPFMSWISVHQVRVQYATLFLVTLIICGGVSGAAESSLPGDALYQVKTSINENIRGLFATTPQSKAQLHVELAVRRLEEAEALASTGKLQSTTKIEVDAQIEHHLSVAKNSLLGLEQKDTPQIDTSTSTATSTEEGTSVDGDEPVATTTDVSLDILMSFELPPPVEETTATSTGTTSDSLEQQLKDATATLREGATKTDSKQYTEAVALVEEVEKRAQKIKLINVEEVNEETKTPETESEATSTSPTTSTSTSTTTDATQ